ncbi:MAG: hypothetical protein O2910_02480 [Proteobacteria bacterium]|nr:hypothetical protein [Pseudomonadota bacterium]
MSSLKTTVLLASFLLVATTGCDDGFRDPVVRVCVQDGWPYSYCDCSAEGIRKVLGLERYLVYSDLILIGGAESAEPKDILNLMEKHKLTPADFAEIRGAIGHLGPDIHKQCAD